MDGTQSVLGKPLSTILHEEDAAKLAKVLKEALLGNAYQVSATVLLDVR